MWSGIPIPSPCSHPTENPHWGVQSVLVRASTLQAVGSLSWKCTLQMRPGLHWRWWSGFQPPPDCDHFHTLPLWPLYAARWSMTGTSTVVHKNQSHLKNSRTNGSICSVCQVLRALFHSPQLITVSIQYIFLRGRTPFVRLPSHSRLTIAPKVLISLTF